MRKRILAGILSLVMILALLPVSALAAEGETFAGSATVSLQQSNSNSVPTWGEKIDIVTADTNGTQFRYMIKIDMQPYYDTYIKPLLNNAGKFDSEDAAKGFTITFPQELFNNELLEFKLTSATTSGTNCVKIKEGVTSGVVLEGNKDANSEHLTNGYASGSFLFLKVPVTLPASKYKEAAEKGGLELKGTVEVKSTGMENPPPTLSFSVDHTIPVEDSSNLAHSLSVTTDGETKPQFEDISWNFTGGNYTVSGEAKDYEGLKVSGDTTIKLDNATIKHTSNEEKRYAPAISIEAGSDAKLILSGTNTIEGGPGCAGIYVAPGAKLTISGTGTLNATGGIGCEYEENGTTFYTAGGAGIGGNGIHLNANDDVLLDGKTASFGTITINNGDITATGGQLNPGNTGAGAGIGSGGGSTKSKTAPAETLQGTIIINNGSIQATGGQGDIKDDTLTGGGAGIGAGGNRGGFYTQNNAINVTISGGNVTAQGTDDGAGIGGGANVDGGVISITGGKVNATGGYEIENGVQYGAYGGAGIGGGDNGGVTSISITGGEVIATAVGAAAGIGGGNDGGMASFIPEYYGPYTDEDGYIYNLWWGKTVYNGSVSISGTADVTAYGGSHVKDTDGGAGIGAGRSYYNDACCGKIVIADTATVKAYAGAKAQAIGVGTYYGGNDVNTLTIADTVTLWAQTQDNTFPALLDKTVADNCTLNYTSTANYLVSNEEAAKAIGYLTRPDGEGKELSYTLTNSTLTIDGTKIAAAKPVAPVDNWATIYGKPQYTVTYYVDGEATKTVVVQGGEKAPEPTSAPSKSGCVFVGWYTDVEKKNPYDFNESVTEDLNLYARFIKVEVKIEIEVKIDVDIIGTGRDVVSIGEDQKDDLAKNVNLETDVQSDTNVIEIDAIVKKAEDKAEIDKITEHLTKNQYNCS